ncbi:hypothetical protein ABIA33_002980 [Streptacidiphilus sp. MAP12-16]
MTSGVLDTASGHHPRERPAVTIGRACHAKRVSLD